MAKQIEIKVPEPCHEDWNKMSIESQGRYCNACKKTVIDFTLMSDEQLVNFFNKTQSHVCGRFNSDQLNKQMLVPSKKIPWLTYFFQVSIPLFLLSLKTNAQQTIPKNNFEITATQKDSLPGNEKTEVFRRVTGKVKDLQDNPIGFASVFVQGTIRGVTADATGNFEIKLSGKEKFIVISSVGYEKQVVPVSATENIIDIRLNRTQSGLTTVVVVAGGAIRRTSKTSKKKKEVAPVVCAQPNSILIYPNPISLNSRLTIKWNYPVTADQEVEIYNISGELIQKENTIVNKYTNTTTIQLLLKNTGHYVVKTIDRKINKVLTAQLLVN